MQEAEKKVEDAAAKEQPESQPPEMIIVHEAADETTASSVHFLLFESPQQFRLSNLFNNLKSKNANQTLLRLETNWDT